MYVLPTAAALSVAGPRCGAIGPSLAILSLGWLDEYAMGGAASCDAEEQHLMAGNVFQELARTAIEKA